MRAYAFPPRSHVGVPVRLYLDWFLRRNQEIINCPREPGITNRRAVPLSLPMLLCIKRGSRGRTKRFGHENLFVYYVSLSSPSRRNLSFVEHVRNSIGGTEKILRKKLFEKIRNIAKREIEARGASTSKSRGTQRGTVDLFFRHGRPLDFISRRANRGNADQD